MVLGRFIVHLRVETITHIASLPKMINIRDRSQSCMFTWSFN